ncbi:MAG: hypothetical protein ACRDJS_06450 [Actinomycetota bacterium]
MSDKKIAKDLDAALEGAEPTHELEPLVEVATQLEDGMDVDAPTASRERALFTRGVGLRRKGFNPLRVVSPALAVVGLVAIIAFVAGRALPGQTLYPVREAMDSVGLANLPEEEFQDHIDDADRLLAQSAGALGSDEPGRAESLALRAMIELEAARGLIDELDRSNRDEAAAEVDRLLDQARTLITTAVLTIEGTGDDDSSGPGSGDDDSSGPGSGDEGDSSGPGSGDEDSSGPGSGDADSSGHGSGEGSGSGSGGSGSGSGDSRGSGSG